MKWLKGLKTDEEKKEFKSNILAAIRVLEKLEEIIDDDIKSLEKKAYSLESYDKPKWDCYQADLMGSIRTLNAIKEILPKWSE